MTAQPSFFSASTIVGAARCRIHRLTGEPRVGGDGWREQDAEKEEREKLYSTR